MAPHPLNGKYVLATKYASLSDCQWHFRNIFFLTKIGIVGKYVIDWGLLGFLTPLGSHSGKTLFLL